MTAERDKAVIHFCNLADAASVRVCGTTSAVLQEVSSQRSFKLTSKALNQIVPLPVTYQH